MNKQLVSPIGETMLWSLYRRLLGADLLRSRVSSFRVRSAAGASGRAAVAAALAENLLPGDTIGLAPNEMVTRYLCGVPLEALRLASHARAGRRKTLSWAIESDAIQGLLPGSGGEQASLALGVALAARLHRSGSITVLVDESLDLPASAARRAAAVRYTSTWKAAAQAAVALRLPLLLITAASAGPTPGPKHPAPALPSIPVDRSDALALYRVIYESATRARSGGGPTWIQYCAWPLSAGETDGATALAKMEAALRARKLFDKRHQRHLQASLEREFAQAGWQA